MFHFLRQFRQFRQQRRETQLRQRLDCTDAAALAGQAAPDPARVLVVRNDSIGDYLLYRPWLRCLAADLHAQGQRLTLAANALWAPLALAWDGDVIDELLPVDFGRFQRDMAYRAETLATIGAGGFGHFMYPLHVREPAVENFFRFLAAPERIGSQGEHRPGPWFAALDAAYTRLLPAAAATLFEYDRNREFYENWRGQPAPAAAPLTVPAAAADLAHFRTALGPRYAVLFPGASARRKRWPVAHFAALARALHQHGGPGLRLVLAGSAADNLHALKRIKKAGAAAPAWLTNLCGQTTLPELAALLAGARLLVSNDTVAAHLAVQAGTPCLTVLMGENYGKFFPYPARLHSGPSGCLFPPRMEARFAQDVFERPDFTPRIGSISPERVLAAALDLLGG